MFAGVRSVIKSSSSIACRCLNSASPFPTKPSTRTPSRKYASYRAAEEYNPEKRIDYEVSRKPEEWAFVSRLLPPKYIPEPKIKDVYPSGWTMQNSTDLLTLPYYLRRSKNHMIPVYLRISHRGMRRLTVIRHVKGDIWLFEKDLKAFLEQKTQTLIGTKIDEVGEKVTVRGDHVHSVLEWVKEKGF